MHRKELCVMFVIYQESLHDARSTKCDIDCFVEPCSNTQRMAKSRQSHRVLARSPLHPSPAYVCPLYHPHHSPLNFNILRSSPLWTLLTHSKLLGFHSYFEIYIYIHTHTYIYIHTHTYIYIYIYSPKLSENFWKNVTLGNYEYDILRTVYRDIF